MIKGKPLWKSRLGIELLLAVVLTLGTACLLYLGLLALGFEILERVVYTPAFQQRQEEASARRLQDYISREGLSMGDHEALDRWARQEQNLVFSLMDDEGEIIYDSIEFYSFSTPELELEIQPTQDVYNTDLAYYGALSLHPVSFSDGKAWAILNGYYQARYDSLANGVALALAFLAFVLLFLLLLRIKTGYITQLESELKLLEGGDLSYPITIKGKDELASLARGIDDMRKAIGERQRREEAAQEANRELITAMSHDLRTPLTALMGYLDILQLGRYADDGQLQHFIQVSRDKAYQLKEMSDKLFEYFLVYGKQGDGLELQQVRGAELLGQLVEESLFDLESEGFLVQRQEAEVRCILRVDVELIRRVFGNLFSNLLKYAHRGCPVTASYWQEDRELVIRLENAVAPGCPRAESTNIGLQTCQRILERHGGSFHSGRQGDSFWAELRLPCLPEGG